jgi:hypothetical protein
MSDSHSNILYHVSSRDGIIIVSIWHVLMKLHFHYEYLLL